MIDSRKPTAVRRSLEGRFADLAGREFGKSLLFQVFTQSINDLLFTTIDRIKL